VTTVLVVNHAHSIVCGIHGLGRRMAVSLAENADLDVAYADCADAAQYAEACETYRPDAVLVNYRSDLMAWVRVALPLYPDTIKLATIHNYDVHTVDAYGREPLDHGFDRTLVLDPTVTPNDPRIIGVGRAIPAPPDGARITHDPPWIGSFGFAFFHKGFPTVAQGIAESLDEAVYKLHMPEAFFNGVSGGVAFGPPIMDMVYEQLAAKPGIVVDYTSNHIDDDSLVAQIGQNDINALFYVPGQSDPGLSSALDYLIAARRPTIVTDCAMFRYGRTPEATVAVWPETSIGDMLEDYDHWQEQADLLYELLAHRFADDVARVIAEF
jgi:hypothetical protein